MKAIVRTEYGSADVLRLETVETPTPKDNEVLIKVYAVGLNAADPKLIRGEPFILRLMGYGLIKPKYKIPGSDVAGRVEAVGKNVTQFKVGDSVFADLASNGSGGLAEYVCAPESVLVAMPANLTFEDAAAVPMASVTALQALRNKGKIKAGQKVLINGASGGVGTFAVQIAKSFGAEVTAVCSTRNLDMARSIGADKVIDYTKENFTRNGLKYDLIVAANGFHSLADYKRALTSNGIYVMSGGSGAQIAQAMMMGPFMSMFGSQTFTNVMGTPNQTDLTYIKGLIESGKVKPVIDRCYPLDQAPEGIRYIEQGHATGKVVITVAASN